MTDERKWRLLKDWNPQEGDVFQSQFGSDFTFNDGKIDGLTTIQWDPIKWSLVSRANQTPHTFGELTDAEKGALLLAKYDGKLIQRHHAKYGWVSYEVSIRDSYVLRIAPTRIKGSVETDADGKPMFDTWEADQ